MLGFDQTHCAYVGAVHGDGQKLFLKARRVRHFAKRAEG